MSPFTLTYRTDALRCLTIAVGREGVLLCTRCGGLTSPPGIFRINHFCALREVLHTARCVSQTRCGVPFLVCI